MMNKRLLLGLLLTVQTVVFGQATVYQNLPPTATTSTQFRAPNGITTNTTLRTHFIIPASEITSLTSGTQFTEIGFNYLDGVLTAASGTIQIYLENTSDATNLKSTTWTTAVGTMTSVYSGAMVLPVGTTPTTLDFTLSTPFTYTGGGLYVAYDYLGSVFDTDAATYVANLNLANSLKTYATVSTTPATVLSSSSAFRPQMRFGYANAVSNDIEVTGIDAQGHPNSLLNSAQTVNTTLTNTSNATLTNVLVTLSITGANPVSTNQTIASITSGESQVVTFSGLSLANNGTQNITVTVPADQVSGNNSFARNQIISCDTIGYSNNAAPNSAVGFDTLSGVLAVKYTTSNNLALEIKGISIGIDNDPSIANNTVKALLLNNAGDIIDSSAAVVLTVPVLGTTVYFPLLTGTIIPANTSFYVGLRQTENLTTGYFPLATQLPVNTPTNLFYVFPEFGGTASAPLTIYGVFVIEAVVDPSVTASQTGTTLTANVTGAAYQWYNCDTQTPVPGATSQVYTATSNGNYSVIVTANCVTDTSNCLTVAGVGIKENIPLINLTVYPSPVSDVLYVELEGTIQKVSVCDVNSKLLFSNEIENEIAQINVSNLATGVYLLKVETETGSVVHRFVKE